MFALILTIHVIACILLITIILIQAGRGGGLVESLSGVESMFGPKTNTFLTRATAIFSTIFLITCVSLALLSLRQSRSLMKEFPVDTQGFNETIANVTKQQSPAAAAQPVSNVMTSTQNVSTQEIPNAKK